MKSIRHTLLLWLYAGLCIGIAIAAGALYWRAQQESNRIFDYQMQQLAASLPTQPFAPMSPGRAHGPDMAKDIVIQIWDGTGLQIYHSHESLSLPQGVRLGFVTVDTPDGPWRVYSAQHGNTVVQVAQPLSARRSVAADTALKTVLPLLALFPFLGALVWVTVTQGLVPVKRVAREVQSRDAGALTPIPDADLPQEIQPLTHALNDLLSRLHRALDAQRAFIADAAHELRTPLTALKLQIQLAERAGTEEDRKAAFAELRQGFERTTHLVHQLLTLARQEPGAAPARRETVELRSVAQQVVGALAPLAHGRGIEFSLDAAVPATVQGDPEALRAMLTNVIENALRYTPEGGRVTVVIREEGTSALLYVEDSGPGIPEAELPRVFDRFYRVPGTTAQGSGLGLAIVKEIAEAHHARVHLANTGHGLRVEILFPSRP